MAELLDFPQCTAHSPERSAVGDYCRNCGRVLFVGGTPMAHLDEHLRYLQSVADAKAKAPSHLLKGTVVKLEKSRLAVKLANKPALMMEEGNLLTVALSSPINALFEESAPGNIWTVRLLEPAIDLAVGKSCQVAVPKFQTEAVLLRIFSHFPQARLAVDRLVECKELPRIKPLANTPPTLLGLDDTKTAILGLAANMQVGGVLAIRGPPGTGKTTTLAKLCKHLVTDRKESVLVVARNHKAVDQALDSIKEADVEPVLRIGNVKKAAARHSPRSLQRYDEGGPFFEGIEEKPGVTGWTLDGVAFRVSRFLPEPCPQWDWCIVDEASLATLPYLGLAGLLSKRLIIVGDDRQLPPILEEAHLPPGPPRLQVTALEHLDANDRKDLVRMLDTQRRSVPGLMDWSSQSLYEGRLKNGRAAQVALPLLFGQTLEHPLVWVDTTGIPQCQHKERYAKDNLGNIAIGLMAIESLHAQGFLSKEILVLTPFLDQGTIWRDWLKQAKLDSETKEWNGLDSSTIDSSQGKQNRVVILDLVRNQPGKPHMGLASLKKLNVALTRGMDLVVVLGPISYAEWHQAPAFASLARWPHKTVITAANALRGQGPRFRELVGQARVAAAKPENGERPSQAG